MTCIRSLKKRLPVSEPNWGNEEKERMKTAASTKRKKAILPGLFRLLFLLAYFLLLFGVTFLGREPEPERMAWLSLFGSFRRAWDERHAFIFWGIVANFVLMVPLGLLLGWGRRGLSFWKVVLCACALSLGIECTQYVTRLGYFDVDDLWTNVWGAAAGGGFCQCMRELLSGIRQDRNPRWGKLLACLLPFAAFLLFFCYFLIRMRQPG